MKENVSVSKFIEAFDDLRPNNFTHDGLIALYDYLVELEEDTGTEIEFDVIAICCDFSEYENLKEFQNDYGEEYETIEDVERNTTVIRIDDEAFIIQNF